MPADLTLGQLIAATLDDRLGGLHVSCPGVIVSYDAATQRCSVQPASHIRVGDEEIALPVIDDVPVGWPRGGGCAITFPLVPGDAVLLVFADRMLDVWRGTGVVSPPSAPRAHGLTDAIALPLGVWPDANPDTRASATDAVIAGPGGASVTIDPTGAVTITAPLGVNVGGPGAQALAIASLVEAQLTALKAALEVLKVDMVALGSATGIGAATAAALTALLPVWPATTAATKARGL